MVISGVLIGESLRGGRPLEDIALTVKKISRDDAGDIEAGQPLTWTFIEFEAPLEDAELLAAELSRAIDETLGGIATSVRRTRRSSSSQVACFAIHAGTGRGEWRPRLTPDPLVFPRPSSTGPNSEMRPRRGDPAAMSCARRYGRKCYPTLLRRVP